MNMQMWLPSGLGIKIPLVRILGARKSISRVYQVPLHPVRTSLVQSLQERLSHQVDILIFNPPYVPTDDVEAALAQDSQDISGAWAGGIDGMYLTNVLLKQVDVSGLPSGLPYYSFVAFPITETSAKPAQYRLRVSF